MYIWKRLYYLSCILFLSVLWGLWGCNIGVTVCKSGAECSLQQRCIDKRCQAPLQENNRPPIARAGVDLRVKKGGRVRLDASTSSDADLDRLSYQWTFTKKPKGSKAVIENANNPQASFVADISGEFEVKLTATDGLGSSDDDTITIRTNYPPQADAGGDQLVLPGATVQLKGGDSWDTDTEDTLSYQWKLIKKPDGSKATLRAADQKDSTFFVDQPGIYFVELKVSDGLDESTDNLRVQVADPKTIIPKLQALDPWRAPRRSITKVALLGDSFIQGAKVFWDDQEIPAEYRSKNRVLVTLDLRTAAMGGHQIKLQNPGGNTTESQLFQVDDVPKPVLSALTPNQGTAGQTVSLNLKGNGFVVGATAYFNNKPLSTKYIEMTSLSAQLSLAGMKAGKYEVFVENEKDKRSNSQLFEVVVLPPKPTIYNHRFLAKAGGASTTGTIDTEYEYLQLYVRGLLPTTQVWVNDQRYGGKTEIQVNPNSTTGTIHLTNFSTKGMKVGYMHVKVSNPSPGQTQESPTYRINLANPYVPTLRYPRFYEANGTVTTYASTERDYKYADVYGGNFRGTTEIFIDGKKYTGKVEKRSGSILRMEPFTTKGMKVGEHSMFLRNNINGKGYESNTVRFNLLDGRIPVISSVYSSDNTTTLYTNRTYTFLRITGYNFRPDAKVIIDGVPHNGPLQNDQGTTLYIYQFSTEKFQPGSHTIVVRNTIQGQDFDSKVRLVQMQDGSTPRIRSAYFRPSSRVYQNEIYQVTMNVENVQNGAKIVVDGKEYGGVVQVSPKVIMLPQFDTTGLSISTHVLQIRNIIGGRNYDSNPYTFTVRRREPPRITQITPPLINQSQSVTIQVSGSYFSTNAKLFVDGKEVIASSITTYRITASFDPSGWKPGRYDVYVQNQDGQKSNVSHIYIAPDLGPALFSISPSEIHLSADKTVSQTVQVYLFGSNIATGAGVFANGKLIGNVTTPTGTGSTARASISLLPLQGLSGDVTITVKNADGKESNKTELVLMAPGTPEIYQVTPTVLSSATQVSLYIRGRGFTPQSQVVIDGQTVSAQYSLRTSQSSPYVEQFYIRLQQSDIQGFGETVKIEVRNPDGQTSPAYVVANYIVKQVTGPILSYVSPGLIMAGSTQASQVYLSGQNFTPSSTVLLDGKSIPASYASSRSIRLTLPSNVGTVGAYHQIQVQDNGKVSNHAPLYFRRGPLVTNVTPPFLQLDTALQTLNIYASGMTPGAILKLFGKSYSVASTSQVIVTLTQQELTNIKPGLHTFHIEQPGGTHKSPTAGLYVVGTKAP